MRDCWHAVGDTSLTNACHSHNKLTDAQKGIGQFVINRQNSPTEYRQFIYPDKPEFIFRDTLLKCHTIFEGISDFFANAEVSISKRIKTDWLNLCYVHSSVCYNSLIC